MPALWVLIVAVAIFAFLHVALRSGMTLDAAFKRFDENPSWHSKLGPGEIEELAE